MSKRSFLIFAIVAVALAIAVPLWATLQEGTPSAGSASVEEADQTAKRLFQTNCGACHTLAQAGTHGIVGPDLNDLITSEGQEERIRSAILGGAGGGAMPAGILRGPQADDVAEWVARAAPE